MSASWKLTGANGFYQFAGTRGVVITVANPLHIKTASSSLLMGRVLTMGHLMPKLLDIYFCSKPCV